ncbi:MAG: chromate transporter [Rhodocyclaceae bacterium]
MNESPGAAALLWQFALYSLMAVGGANALLPEIHQDIVATGRWMTDAEFTQLFAIAQAAPGPNVLVVTLIGWKLAGFAGALACTVGMCAPPALLSYQVGRLWQRFSGTRWRRTIEFALAPISAGLVLGSGTALVRVSATDTAHLLIAGACAIAGFTSRRNPLWWLLLAASAGAAMHLLQAA